MQVKQVMRRLIHTVRAEATVEEAARHMLNENIGLLPVVEEALVEETHLKREVAASIGFLPVVEQEVLVGVVTTRDIVVRAIAVGKDPNTTLVSEIMTHDFACCHEDDDISQAVDVMKQRKVRRVFALNREERVVGLLSRGDILASGAGASEEVRHAISD